LRDAYRICFSYRLLFRFSLYRITFASLSIAGSTPQVGVTPFAAASPRTVLAASVNVLPQKDA
jgi:hypothetical protein